MTASLLSLPVRRPVATAMVFLAIVLLGVAGWRRIPVELLPALEGDRLFVGFVRPGSEPEVVEREILIPLEARVSELEGVRETRAEIVGSTGQMTVRFAPETPLQVRELEGLFDAEVGDLVQKVSGTLREGTAGHEHDSVVNWAGSL